MMPAVLLDTCVVSELTRDVPSADVVRYLDQNPDTSLSVITVQELEFGIACLDAGRTRRTLETWLTGLTANFAGRICEVTLPIGRLAAQMRADTRRSGGTLHLADALIGATARVHGCQLATRNLKDFAGLDLALVNPWSGA